ncbi:hypothetical protein AX15_005184 [Amanita polypyramis BW_CC]|nr:hypothetical protein AX15_005184 [Amanita polypyramis BW_CC]
MYTTVIRSNRAIAHLRHRFYSTHISSTQLNALDNWIASPAELALSSTIDREHLSDLYITLPTRDGIRKPYEEPRDTQPLAYGHHLAFFHTRTPESLLKADSTDPVLCPPEPFTRRMWAGGKFEWNNANPLLIGSKATAHSTIASVEKKGFENGKPMVFVSQKIEIVMQGSSEPSAIETRSHVYLPEAPRSSGKTREIKDIPSKSDFSFTYLPSLTTLFRFSALTFNSHHIHLDKDIAQQREGYPERLVHGPLTALMLLEATAFNNPDIKLKSLAYRAVNPMIVNHKMTIHGTWLDNSTAKLWCVDENGVVGMVGSMEKAV